MAQRLELQALLESIITPVYFQPPTNIRMLYPCIVYETDGAESEHADNQTYRHVRRYQLTVIHREPDSELPDKVFELPMCEFNRFYTADNLNHSVFTLYF